jgi:N-methylhydantoinase A
LPSGAAARHGTGGSLAVPVAERRIMIEGTAVAAPVYRFEALAAEQAVAGPALVESATTTVLLRPGDAARMDARGWLDIAVG